MHIQLSNVIYHKDGGVATITLNRPETLNARTHGPGSMDSDLLEALRIANEDDEIGCVILTGAGRAFSVGGDMRPERSMPQGAVDWYRFHEEEDRVDSLIYANPKPIVGAINGLCYGAGMILAAHLDLRIASDTARFGLIESRMGHSGITVFPFLIGAHWSKFLMLTGELISANKAREIGFVLDVFPHEHLLERAQDLARRVAAMPRASVFMTKRTINATLDVMGWATNKMAARGTNAVTDSMAHLTRAADGRVLRDILREEGLKAFLAARDAPFSEPWLEE